MKENKAEKKREQYEKKLGIFKRLRAERKLSQEM